MASVGIVGDIEVGDNSAVEQIISESEGPQPRSVVFQDPNKFFGLMAQPDEELEEPAEQPPAADETVDQEPPAEEEVEAVEATPEENEAPVGNRAQKRIQALASEKKRLTEQLSEVQGQFQTVFQQQQQIMQQQLQLTEQKYAQQMEALQAKIEKQSAEYEKLNSRAEEEGLSDLEKYERKLLAQAEAKAEARMKAQLEPLQEELRGEKARREKISADFQRTKVITDIKKAASAARATDLYAGLGTDEVDAKFAEQGDALVLTWTAAYGVKPADAAKQLKTYLDKYADARAKSRVKAKTASPAVAPQPTQRTSGNRLPASPTSTVGEVSAQRTSTGLPAADREQILANGYRNYFEWFKAGSPPLKKKAAS